MTMCLMSDSNVLGKTCHSNSDNAGRILLKKTKLSEFVIKQNAIYIPYDKELPIKTIENVVRQSFDKK